MHAVAVVLTLLLAAVPSTAATDPIAEARRLYNLADYEGAERSARQAIAVAPDAAQVVLGRIRLERYRRSADPLDLSKAREALRLVDPRTLKPTERVELTIGLGEALYLEDRFGPSAELFEGALDASSVLGPAAHERVLDWWATALDRLAQSRPAGERAPIYERVLERMEAEVAKNPGSTPGGYWVAAAARGTGDLERAWSAAAAGWVRAALARDRGAALRADLDRLVLQAIIPERSNKLAAKERAQAAAGMTGEWDALKSNWAR